MNLNFGEISERYDKYAISQKKAAYTLINIMKNFIIDDINVLDVGCATGCNSSELKKLFRNVNGIDIDIKMIEKADKTRQYTQLIHGDILKYNSINHQNIFCNSVLYYFNGINETFESIKRIMSNKTIFAIQYQYESSPQLLSFIEHAKTLDIGYILKSHKYITNKLSPDQFKEVCLKAGFKIKFIEQNTDILSISPKTGLDIFNSGWCNPWLNLGYPKPPTDSYKAKFREYLYSFYNSLSDNDKFNLEVPRLYAILGL